MHFVQNERTALFIDGASLYSASRHLGFDVDYRNMLEYFRTKTNVVRAYYYSALLDTEDYSPLRPLTDWLAYNGYSLVTKTVFARLHCRRSPSSSFVVVTRAAPHCPGVGVVGTVPGGGERRAVIARRPRARAV